MRRVVAVVAAQPSFGQLAGLHGEHDSLQLKSSVALVVDQETKEVLFSKNEQAVLPIASITKLMTGLLVLTIRNFFRYTTVALVTASTDLPVTEGITSM